MSQGLVLQGGVGEWWEIGFVGFAGLGCGEGMEGWGDVDVREVGCAGERVWSVEKGWGNE